jgi:hypothetical protein
MKPEIYPPSVEFMNTTRDMESTRWAFEASTAQAQPADPGRLAAVLLHKMGETSITLTPEDLAELAGSRVIYSLLPDGGIALRIVPAENDVPPPIKK